ncbi:iron-sulfur cluster-binding protein [Thermogladius sp. 4427co]|uniref:iron-sulfur cluster-binding protein n=1 Tax=Thermogladius sp. 4427co TaxID=3450718 RepID=UPI003F78D21B
MPKILDCIISEITQLNKSVYLMELSNCPLDYFVPGQFVMIKVNGIETILRRPYAIFDYDDGKLKILFKVVGRGSRILSESRPGEWINLIGPLGNGFPIKRVNKAVLLSRGIGFASLAYLGKKLKTNNIQVYLVASFRSKEEDFISGGIIKVGDYVNEYIIVYDEDGTSELENVQKIVSKISPEIVYTCGSHRFIRMLKKLPLEAYASLEERMGCGLGVCLSCVVKTIYGYRYICKDGPVFNVRELEV